METFIPCPAFGLWVWQASPAMNTLGSRVAISSSGTSSNLSVSRWPISYTDHQGTSFASNLYGWKIRRALAMSSSTVILRLATRSPISSLASST